MTIQNMLIRRILQPLSAISNRISVKVRNIAFVICGLMIFFASFIYQSERFTFRYLLLFSFDCLMAGGMLFFSLPKTIYPIQFDKLLLLPWCGFSVMALIAGLTKSEDYLPDAMLYLVMYPVFFLVWSNCDFKSIQKKLILIVQISFVVFLGINFLFCPITGHQYSGFFSNVNGVSYYLSLVFACSLQNIISHEKGRAHLLCNYIFLGISAALVVYSNSRTGQLSLIATFFLTAGLLFFVNRRSYGRLFVRRILPAALSILIFFPTTLYLFQFPGMVTQIVSDIRTPEQPSEPTPEQPSEPTPEQPSEPTPEQPNEPSPAAEKKLDDIISYNEMKTDMGGRTLNQFSTGRLSIWKAYYDNLSFWGHSNVTNKVTVDLTEYYSVETIRLCSSAHQTILEFAYRFGILAGLCYFAFNISAGLKSIRYACKRPDDAYAIMPFVITIVFGSMSLVTSFSGSFCDMIVFYYYLMQTPIMRKESATSA